MTVKTEKGAGFRYLCYLHLLITVTSQCRIVGQYYAAPLSSYNSQDVSCKDTASVLT